MVLFLIDGSTAVSISAASATHSSIAGGSDAHSIAAMSVKTSNTTAHLDYLVSERGDRILSAIRAQGLPAPVTVIVHKDEAEEGGSVGGGTSSGREDSPLGRHVGGNYLEDATMNDEEDDDEDEMEDEDALASLPGQSLMTSRSMKSIKRSYLRKRSELKRYVARLAATEFGEAGNKVVEVDIPENIDGADGTVIKMDEASVAATINTTAAISATVSRSQSSVAALVRMLCTMSASGPHWVADAPRPYLVTDGSINSAASDRANAPPVRYDEASRELKLTGYIRGNAPWNCNQPVHVPHLGTFAVKDIRLAGVSTSEDSNEMLPPIIAAGRKARKVSKKDANVDMVDATSVEDADKDGLLLAKSDPEERESLEMFASPDALEGEQNLIGFDDDDGNNHFDDDVDNLNEKPTNQPFQPGTSRPAGWSDYQSAWLDALDPNDDEDAEDRGELAFALNKKTTEKDDADGLMDEDAEVTAEEKRALLAQRQKSAREDLQFPDEVDHEEEVSARDRYARYRALKSFRKSYWDPKENLPESYGAVYHFSSFKATQRDVLEDVKGMEDIVGRRGWGVGVGVGSGEGAEVDMDRDSDDEEEEMQARACVPPGAYVTITLEGVPSSAFARLEPTALVTAVSLLPHENKVSVLHMGLTNTASNPTESDSTSDGEQIPIKSKDVLTFRCGWRTWRARPIFSQHNLNSDKHKFERYMPASSGGGGTTYFAGSVFGPVTYAPCPVMMFREGKEDGVGTSSDSKKREFVAHGSMLGADADRIVLKRIILTGYPTRVHKRHATVKYMFYNPEDVRWFMPAGITTKHGLQGNIIQSVGDHGVMKCLFNAPIKQHDTVCLPLYKRVFPKFAPVTEEGDAEDGGESKHFRVL
jgi:pre-rRNA-processing protein TSR1